MVKNNKSKDIAPKFRVVYHTVVFRYKDAPSKCHILCIDNGAAGWGNNIMEAFNALIKTFEGQIKETLKMGIDFFFPHGEIDGDWVKALKVGKHPAPDIIVEGSYRIVIEFDSKRHSTIRYPQIEYLPAIISEPLNV